jgi:cytochrome c-type biogenesis protein
MTGTTVGVAAAAGVATFFSPCAYALLPGYVGYYVASTETDQPPLGGAILRGLAAVAGVLAVFLSLGVVAAAVGQTLQPIFPVLEAAVGMLLVGLGALLAAGRSFEIPVRLPERSTTLAGFAAFGALYALAAAGCVAPLFLAVTFQSLTLPPAGTAAVFLTYATVFGGLLLGVTVATAVGNELAASTVAPYAAVASRLAGVVVALAGIGQLAIAAGWV